MSSRLIHLAICALLLSLCACSCPSPAVGTGLELPSHLHAGLSGKERSEWQEKLDLAAADPTTRKTEKLNWVLLEQFALRSLPACRLFARAVQHRSLGDASLALSALEEAIKREPTWSYAWLFRAELVEEIDPAKATVAYRQGVDAAPSSGLLLGLATCLEDEGALDEALRLHDKRVKTYPQDVECRWFRGKLLARMRLDARALQDLSFVAEAGIFPMSDRAAKLSAEVRGR